MGLVAYGGERRKRTTTAHRGLLNSGAMRSGPIGFLAHRWTGEKRPLEMSPERYAIAALGRITRRRP